MENDHFYLLFCKIETRPHGMFFSPISKRFELEQRDCAQMKALFKSFQMVYYFFVFHFLEKFYHQF